MHDDLELRNAYYDAAASVTPYLAAQTRFGTFIVHTSDRHIGRAVFGRRGRNDMGLLARTCRLLGILDPHRQLRGRTFLDVGANIGTTTVPAILRQGFGHAFAFEPEPENFKTLRLNIAANDLDDRVTPLRVALSDNVGSIELVIAPDRSGKHWVIADEDKRRYAKESATMIVPTATLDSVILEQRFAAEDIGLLWMDAQGHEGHILHGAKKLVQAGVPIALEWDPSALDQVGDRDAIQEVAARDYTHFIDVRGNRAGARYILRGTAELADYSERFLERGRPSRFTDILILRLDDDGARAVTLDDAMGWRARSETPPSPSHGGRL